MTHKKLPLIFAATSLVAVTACSGTGGPNDNLNTRGGAAAGALTGALIGAVTGDNRRERQRGALIGAALGAAGSAARNLWPPC